MMRNKFSPWQLKTWVGIALCMQSAISTSQEINCDSLKSTFEDKKYQLILDYERSLPPNFDLASRLCLKNLAGLSQLKVSDTSNADNLGYALQLFGLSAQQGYLPSAYNLLKYEFLLTNAALDPILNGLAALVEAGALDANRNVSMLSYELGNRIIDSCYKDPDPICKGRKVSEPAKNAFISNSGKALEQIREETNARTAGERSTKAKIALALSIVLIAAGAALATNSVNLATQQGYFQPAPNPATHPWLFQQQSHGCYGSFCW